MPQKPARQRSERRKRSTDRRSVRRTELVTLRADLDACSDQVSRLEKRLEQLTKTVADLHEKMKS